MRRGAMPGIAIRHGINAGDGGNGYAVARELQSPAVAHACSRVSASTGGENR